MIQWLLIRDGRTGKPAGLFLQQGSQTGYIANSAATPALNLLVKADRLYTRKREGDTVYRDEVKRGDSNFLDALRYQVIAPLLPDLIGYDRTSHTLQEAGRKLWGLLVDDQGEVPVMETA